MRQDFAADPDFDEFLGQDAHNRLAAITLATADDLGQHSASHAATQLWALTGYSAVRAQLKNAQDAWAKLAAFLEAVGGQAVAPSRLKKVFVSLLLAASALAEADLAFPGIRFSLGRFGQINSPFDDPLTLVIGVIIGLISVAVAHLAANQFSWSERSVIKEPEEAGIHHHHLTPLAVRADEQGNNDVLGQSPLDHYTSTVTGDPLADPTDVPASAEVEAEEVHRNEEAKRRFDHILRGGRSCGLARKIGLGLVAFGIGLWTVNGIMRVSYLSHIHPSTGPSTGGLLGASAPAVHTASLVSLPTEVAIVLFSILLFLASAGIVFALYTPAQLRGEELRRNAETEKKHLLKTLKRFEGPIRDHEDIKSKVSRARLKGKTASTSERIPREDF